MKKIGLLLLSVFCLCLVGCGTTIQKHNVIDIKYADEPVDIYGFDTFDTSKSSFIEEAYYDENNEYLILNLTGTYYHWCSFPKDLRNDFKESDSLGGFFNKYIKGEYPCYDQQARDAEEQERLEQERQEQERIEREEQEKQEKEAQLRLQQQQAAAKKEMCDALRAKANSEIAEIESLRSNRFCNNLNQQYEKIKQLENKIKNVNTEVNNMYKGDVPQYITSSTKANLVSKYQDEIESIYRMISHYNANECDQEQMHNRQLDELILQRQARVVNEGC